MMEAQTDGVEHVSNRDGVPKAVGQTRYLDPAFVETECRDFREVLASRPSTFAEPFLTAPSPGIIAAAMKNEHYESEEAYLAALGAMLAVEYGAIVNSGFLLQIDAPDLAMERHISYQDLLLSAFICFLDIKTITANGLDALLARTGLNFTYLAGFAYPGKRARHVDLADSPRSVWVIWPRQGEPWSC